MPTKKTLGTAVLFLSALAFGIDRPTPQVRIETKLVEVGPGVISADFGLNFGHVYANFPSDMAAGDRVSGSLAVVPKGKNEAERSANAASLRALDVEICGSKFSVTSGLFVCPRVSPGGMDVRLLIGIEPLGRLFVEPKVSALPERQTFILPTEAVGLGRSRILGPFAGDLGASSISIGDAPAHLVAESPRACIFDVPEGPAGPGTIKVRDGAKSVSGPFRIIGLHLTPPKPIIHTGDTTSFGAEVSGLSGLDHTLSLVLKNLSTGVVSMEGGDEQTMLIAPEKVSSSGAFAISRKLAGLHRGDYVVNVSVPWEEAAAKERTKESESPTGGATTKEAVRASIDEAMKRLPKGYKIVENPAGGFMATPDSLRPGLPIAWDDRHKTWMPPGFHFTTDLERIFNESTGANGVWDDKSGRWIDAKTGNPLSYEQ